MNNIFTDVCSLLTVHFRNCVTDPITGRGTDYVDNFVGDGTSVLFELTHKATSNVSYVSVDGVEKYNVRDYEVNYGWSTQYSKVIFTRAPKTGAVIIVRYHCGQHFIFPGWVNANLNPSMPRGGFTQLPGGEREEVGVGMFSEGAIKESVSEFFDSTSEKNFYFTDPNSEIETVIVESATPLFAPADFLSDATGIYFRENIPAGLDILFVQHKTNNSTGLRRAVRYKLKYQMDIWAQNPRFRDDLASQLVEAISDPQNRTKLAIMSFVDVIVTETPQDLDVGTSQTANTNIFRKTFEFQVTIECYYDELLDKIQEVVINPITVQS